MSSRLRKAYVAAKFYELAHRWARARHSEAAAACSSVSLRLAAITDEQELIPTDWLSIKDFPWDADYV
jgi:hypothetical protein